MPHQVGIRSSIEHGVFGNGVGVGNGVYEGTKIMGRMAKELALGIRCFPTFTSTVLYTTV